MFALTKGSGPTNKSWWSRRRISFLFGALFFLLVLLFVKERYFYRADILKPVSLTKYPKKVKTHVEVHVKETKSSLWKYFGFSNEESSDKKKSNEVPNGIQLWQRWMEEHPTLTSIGDVYDKCDNKTREKIGKIVLEPNEDSGVKIISYVNQTYRYDVTKATSKMIVNYKGSLLYEKDYDMCEMAKKMDTPYECPINKGRTIIIRDTANMPSYIPKGKYTVKGIVYDQNGAEIGCSFAEFKTGET